jgi:FMN-dependent NADH-azoreductase
MKILRVDSAVTGEDSVSRELTEAMVAHFTRKHADAHLTSLDLAADPIPHQDAISVGALRIPPSAQSDVMKAAVPGELAILRQFMESDIVVIGAPMYNYSIPSQLKAWLDRLAVPGMAFTYSENGPQGLAGGRRVIVASSQGGAYEAGDASEHQESLLKTFFALIGIDTVEVIRADKVAFGPEARQASIAQAMTAISQL